MVFGNVPVQSRDILVVGLNPAYQRTMTFAELRLGEVNRAVDSSILASGKGINFARAAKKWGRGSVVHQFLGGDTGKAIVAMLDTEGIAHRRVEVPGRTRVCTTCLCAKTGTMTELIEPSEWIPAARAAELLDAVIAALPGAAAVAICGTYPPGIGGDLYATIAREAKKTGVPCLLDGFTGVEQALDEGVDILKINQAELKTLSGEDDVAAGVRWCLDKGAARTVAITAGASEAFLGMDGRLWRLSPPSVAAVNPLGAGDTVAAVTLAALLDGVGFPESFALGLAAGSASCASTVCAEFDKNDAISLRSRMRLGEVANF